MNNNRYRGKQKKRPMQFEHRVTFRIDAKHHEQLDSYAESQGMTLSFLVRHLVIRFLENQRTAENLPTGGA